MTLPKFFIRISDMDGIDPYFAERYRSVFRSDESSGLGECFLRCGDWTWVSNLDIISDCYIKLKVLRNL